ncbi:AlpA family phage regulatory protein [Sodalis endosymbiont of Spalangia cameroni]|uniref:helix-turn-helix transcriptional regulator n=1 Tax=Sodalis praecaptivus TaxID=1239307 RepID=UPI0031F91009
MFKPAYMMTRKEVMALLRYKSESGFYGFCKRTPDFPRPIALGIRRVGWPENEVKDFLARRMKTRQMDNE